MQRSLSWRCAKWRPTHKGLRRGIAPSSRPASAVSTSAMRAATIRGRRCDARCTSSIFARSRPIRLKSSASCTNAWSRASTQGPGAKVWNEGCRLERNQTRMPKKTSGVTSTSGCIPARLSISNAVRRNFAHARAPMRITPASARVRPDPSKIGWIAR